jgi:penicillin-binding protein 1C
LQTSRNIPAIKILNRLGTNTLVQRFTTANINLQFPQSTIQPGLPLALGGVGLRLEDLARLYVSLANGGIIKELRVLETAPLNQTSNFILSQTAAWYLTDILAESQPPAGFTVNRRQIAFKTGTSYGFRDAWAIGYDTLHTVAVWLGRPDNGYTANLSGLQSAAPIMLEIFAHLPKAGSFPRYAWERATLLQTPPSNVLITERDLPSKLRHFDYPTPFAQLTIPPQNKLTILYPPTGAVIAANDTAMKVHIEISGGKAPFHILENGKPIKTANDRQTLDWIPTTNGRVHLTVLDTNGHADRIQLNIEP